MKRKYILKISILLLSLALVYLTNCKKETDGEKDFFPKLAIYKTSGEYFNYANTWGKSNGPIELRLNDSRISVINGDTVYSYRWSLINDYIISAETTIEDYFTNITYAEIVAYSESHSGPIPPETFFDRVIDTNPFIEFYIDENSIFRTDDSISSIQKLNKIIADGELEKYFKKIK